MKILYNSRDHIIWISRDLRNKSYKVWAANLPSLYCTFIHEILWRYYTAHLCKRLHLGTSGQLQMERQTVGLGDQPWLVSVAKQEKNLVSILTPNLHKNNKLHNIFRLALHFQFENIFSTLQVIIAHTHLTNRIVKRSAWGLYCRIIVVWFYYGYQVFSSASIKVNLLSNLNIHHPWVVQLVHTAQDSPLSENSFRRKLFSNNRFL